VQSKRWSKLQNQRFAQGLIVDKKISIARLGRTVGLKGEMKLHNLSDFPEQFRKGAIFPTDKGALEIERYDSKRGIVKFKGIDSIEDAKPFVNSYLYSDTKTTKENIPLKEGEYFWFDLFGLDVYEDGQRLGEVKDIHRYSGGDYLEIATDEALVAKGLPKTFLIPFLEPFIENVDISQKRISVKSGKDLLEAS